MAAQLNRLGRKLHLANIYMRLTPPISRRLKVPSNATLILQAAHLIRLGRKLHLAEICVRLTPPTSRRLKVTWKATLILLAAIFLGKVLLELWKARFMELRVIAHAGKYLQKRYCRANLWRGNLKRRLKLQFSAI